MLGGGLLLCACRAKLQQQRNNSAYCNNIKNIVVQLYSCTLLTCQVNIVKQSCALSAGRQTLWYWHQAKVSMEKLLLSCHAYRVSGQWQCWWRNEWCCCDDIMSSSELIERDGKSSLTHLQLAFPEVRRPSQTSSEGGPLLEASRRGRSLDWRLGRLETEWLVSQSDCGTVGGEEC